MGIDGATREKRATRLSGRATDLRYTATGVFSLDRERGVLRALDRHTLQPTGDALALPRTVSADTTDDRALWVADGSDGSITAYTLGATGPTGRRTEHVFPGERSPRLTSAQGAPVLVAAGRAMLLTSTGAVARTLSVEIGAGDVVQGAVDAPAFVVVRGGSLTVCDFEARACGPEIAVGAHGSAKPVLLGGKVFLTDGDGNRVLIADTATASVNRTEPLSDHVRRFDLVEHDWIVYFNDPETRFAGVISPDGTVRRLEKYQDDPPATAVTPGPTPTSAGPTTRTGQPGTSTGKPARARTTGGTMAESIKPSGPRLPELRVEEIVTNPATPEVLVPVAFSARVTGAPTAWRWTVSKPDGTTEATSTGAEFSHWFRFVGKYRVSLAVSAGSRRDEQTVTLMVINPPLPLHCGDVVRQSTVLRANLTCEGPALTIGAHDVLIDLDGHTVVGDIKVDNNDGSVLRRGTVQGQIKLDGAGARIEDLTLISLQVSGSDTRVTRSRAEHISIVTGGSDYRISDSVITGSFSAGSSKPSVGEMVGCELIGAHVGLPGRTHSVFRSNVFRSATVLLSQSGGTEITNNIFDASTVELRISSGVILAGNSFGGADVAVTIDASPAQGILIERNTFEGNKVGLHLGSSVPQGLRETRVSGNHFEGNGAAGATVSLGSPGPESMTIEGNTFVGNGHRSDGLVDRHGLAIDDGLHIDTEVGGGVEIASNSTRNNADHGIEAPRGAVVDLGGNTSSGDPAGCTGVVCR
ncbi:right-handed parallel beta-helix repeat-containing protein [Actinokineospora auranticolor]|uniref:right-handed parallel beta-helix repeat-containing protein n=1 Tax=Actinokineospora auranticolor TaxID=155976 RepID=UPI0011B0BEBB|nr:right-handed parallel beta-helix repeat-containing protein [Actinokineospora auranticolor]